MDQNNKIAEIFILRFFMTIVIYMANIDPWLKILLILSMDLVKGIPMIGYFKKGEKSKNRYYQYYDKILDLFGYYLTYYIVVNNKLLPENEIKILKYILFYRTIGSMIYFTTGNRQILFYFIDLFKEFLLIFYLFPPKSKMYYIGLTLSIVIKIWVEYSLHVKKTGIDLISK